MKRLVLGLLLLAAPAAAVLPEPDGDPDVAAARQAIDGGRYELGLQLLQAVLERLPGDPDVLVYVVSREQRGSPRSSWGFRRAEVFAFARSRSGAGENLANPRSC